MSEAGESAQESGSWSAGSFDPPARIPMDYRGLGWIWAPERGWCRLSLGEKPQLAVIARHHAVALAQEGGRRPPRPGR
jgi:hypothetical protein